jgi:hypothetical protein
VRAEVSQTVDLVPVLDESQKNAASIDALLLGHQGATREPTS